MKRWSVTFHGLLVLASVVATEARAASPDGPWNVLFIAVDDLRPELGCYGVDYAQSPAIDRLAAQGMTFTNHFVQVATCGASRYALLTGRSPSRSGAMSNQAAYAGPAKLSHEQLPSAQTLPELFRRSGYQTVCIGKISHTPDGRVYAYDGRGDGHPELPHAWDELPTPFGPWERGWGAFFAYAGGRHREDRKGHRDLMEFVAEKDDDLPDGMMASAAVAKLRSMQADSKPFFLGLGFFKPHLPFVATKGDWEAVARTPVPPPPHPGKGATAYWHRSNEFNGYAAPFQKGTPLGRDDSVKARRAYLACVRYVDRQIGRVLAAVDELGLSDNTIVVLWGDHGWHLGDTAIWGKHTPLERAMHGPLILRVPGMTKPGARSDALVETLDIYPTLIDICRPSFTKTAHLLDGVSLVPVLTGTRDRVRDAATSYWGGAITVRTATHRLIVTPDTSGGQPTKVELYDMREGPDPIENLADHDPALVKQLMKLLPQR
jgi:arylsulfatase A-like enzyme